MFPTDRKIVDAILKLLAQECMLATGLELLELQDKCLWNIRYYLDKYL